MIRQKEHNRETGAMIVLRVPAGGEIRAIFLIMSRGGAVLPQPQIFIPGGPANSRMLILGEETIKLRTMACKAEGPTRSPRPLPCPPPQVQVECPHRSSAASPQREALCEVSVNAQQPSPSATPRLKAAKAAGDALKDLPAGGHADDARSKAEGTAEERGEIGKVGNPVTGDQNGMAGGEGDGREGVVIADVSNRREVPPIEQLLHNDTASAYENPLCRNEYRNSQIESCPQNGVSPAGQGGVQVGPGETRRASVAASKRGRDWSEGNTGTGTKKRSMGGGRWSTTEEQPGDAAAGDIPDCLHGQPPALPNCTTNTATEAPPASAASNPGSLPQAPSPLPEAPALSPDLVFETGPLLRPAQTKRRRSKPSPVKAPVGLLLDNGTAAGEQAPARVTSVGGAAKGVLKESDSRG
ncbi:hypothetical protein KFL_002390010, partial [Klebsormidium nitens]